MYILRTVINNKKGHLNTNPLPELTDTSINHKEQIYVKENIKILDLC